VRRAATMMPQVAEAGRWRRNDVGDDEMVGLTGSKTGAIAAPQTPWYCLLESAADSYSDMLSLPFRGCYGVFRYRSSISSRNGRWTIQLWTRLEKSILGFKMKCHSDSAICRESPIKNIRQS